IATWLQARLVQSDWRPVPLKEGVFYRDTIYFLDGTEKTVAGKGATESLVTDILEDGGQALVFVNSRRSAQRYAHKLMEAVDIFLDSERAALRQAAEDMRSPDDATVIAQKLAECLEHGVAFHHAGLLHRHRTLIESLFRQRILKCIVATPTLAAGVNTPARRVVMQHIYRYSGEAGCMVPIPLMEVKQAMGRAGRPGYDEVGEAVLLAKSREEKHRLMEEYLRGEVEPVYSKLGSEPALRIHLLALIATNFAVTRDEILEFLGRTFAAHQAGTVPQDTVEDILLFLEENGFIARSGIWKATLFGQKTSSLYLDPLSALKMREALEAGRGSDFGYLHAVCATPDMRCLYLAKRDQWVEEKLEQEKLLLTPPLPMSPDYEWFLAEVKTAALLHDWIEEKHEDAIVQRYNVGPGDIRSKVEIAEWLLHAMRELARQFDFEAVTPLTNLIMRVTYGCREELLNLVQLRGIGRVRARALYNAGFRSVNDLRGVSIERLARVPHIGTVIARSIKEQVE
ncbi:MAG: helix-hairpin-helix domain-containing protein, partial [Candidatus Thermoplasmatota archaeon]|nr:helix-hairpin-helix domain-containing protein [Candidatus Thermoplasmatota archaeon]